MDLGLTGCGALVTGASRGLGRPIARALAREGFQTLDLAARERAGLDAVAAEIAEETGAFCTAHAVDLTRESEVQALWDRCGASVDLLVNNAGAVAGGSLEEVERPLGGRPGTSRCSATST